MCDFCCGIGEYMTPYLTIRRRSVDGFPEMTVTAEIEGCPQYADCSGKGKKTVVLPFRFCPECGAKMDGGQN